MFDAVSLVASLKACAIRQDFVAGSQLHTYIADNGLLQTNIYVGNALVSMYARCGALEKAQEVFDELPVRNLVSWNSIITGFAHEGLEDNAFGLLDRMKIEGFSPNAVTFTCLFDACGDMGNIAKGQELHSEILKLGLATEETTLSTALLDMYANCGMFSEAQEVFNVSLAQDVVAWTALINGYVRHGRAEEALDCYDRMQSEGCVPNAVTYSSVLKACASLEATEKGQEIHAKIVQEGLLERDSVLTNSLLDMYAKCGLLNKVQELFNELQVVDVFSWTALIAGYVLYGFGAEALSCFQEMRNEGFLGDIVTFLCILRACSIMGAATLGQMMHNEIVMYGLLEDNDAICTALVNMYANCGMLSEAQDVFDKMLTRDVIVWTALLEGYAQFGMDNVVFEIFTKMAREKTKPNPITFTMLINSCCHRGLVEKGELYFKMISTSLNMFPILEHFTCMVDLYGRAGHLTQALSVIEEMPFSANPMIWDTFLCASEDWFRKELGASDSKRTLEPGLSIMQTLMNRCFNTYIHERWTGKDDLKDMGETSKH